MARWHVRIAFTCDEERQLFDSDRFEGLVFGPSWQDADMRLYCREARRRRDRNHYVPARAILLASGEYEVRFGYPAAGTVVLCPPCQVAVQKVPRADPASTHL